MFTVRCPYPKNPPSQTGFAMNPDPESALSPAYYAEEAHTLAEQDVSEATREALLSARAAETRRIYAMHVRVFGAWLEEDVLLATPIDVANYMAGPGAERSHSWRLQALASITGAFEEAGLPSPAAHAGVRRTLKGLRRQKPLAPRQAASLTEAVIAAIEATATKPRIGRGGHLESEVQAKSRGQLDIALIRVMRDALLCRSEAEALVWKDVGVEPDGSGRLTLAMPTKTDQEAAEPHTAYLTRATVAALTRLWTPYHTPEMPLFGLCARQISQRIRAAARAAGLVDKYSGHSGRTGAAHSLENAEPASSSCSRQAAGNHRPCRRPTPAVQGLGKMLWPGCWRHSKSLACV